MKELIILGIVTILLFGASLTMLIVGLVKKRRKLLVASGAAFVLFMIVGVYASFILARKSYNRVNEMLRPRTGKEIYVALFGKPEADCVKVLHHQDQVLPKIDYAILLHFNTCPEEMARVLQQQPYTEERTATKELHLSAHASWFTPETLGDTLLVYDYKLDEYGNGQTIYSNLSKTEAYCVDVLD